MLLVTFHQKIGNIYGYDETNPGGKPIKNLLEISGPQLSELRGMLLANGFLYVVNGGKTVSNVLCCSPDPNNKYHYNQAQVFVSSALSDAVNHPFDVAFRLVMTTPAMVPTGQVWYVSNQDSNVVVSFSSLSPYDSPDAANPSAYLSALLTALQNAGRPVTDPVFRTGTFVPTNIVGAEIPAQPTVDPLWGGLTPIFNPPDTPAPAADAAGAEKKGTQKVQNSVRGVVVSNGVLYVADEGGNAVRMYDPVTGIPWGSTTVSGPVHLLVQDGILYVTSGDSVWYGPCVAAPANPPAPPSQNQFSGGPVPPPYPAPPSGYTNSVTLTLSDLGLNLPKGSGPSGITFDTSGNLYVALRKTSEIYEFVPNPATDDQQPTPPFVPVTKGNPIFKKLPDEPEFLLWVA
jgi:hypothetical protein